MPQVGVRRGNRSRDPRGDPDPPRGALGMGASVRTLITQVPDNPCEREAEPGYDRQRDARSTPPRARGSQKSHDGKDNQAQHRDADDHHDPSLAASGPIRYRVPGSADWRFFRTRASYGFGRRHTCRKSLGPTRTTRTRPTTPVGRPDGPQYTPVPSGPNQPGRSR